MRFTVLFPYCGIGGGALGFLQAKERIGGADHEFVSLGGIDIDAMACKDFERLTGSPALCADMNAVTPEMLRRVFGARRPDVIFGSPPCKGMSGLLGEEKSKTPKYEALNKLVLVWIDLMLATWPEDLPPLVLLENVPRITTRGKKLLAQVKARLRKHGYQFHEGTHDCGEIGGLAQHRRRYLLVARRVAACASLLYQPLKKRVLGCGEVLETLPLPNTESAGPLHKLPNLSLLNWIRLACIRPGGDWRDLPESITPAALNANSHTNLYTVRGWDDPMRTIMGATRPGSGAPSVADVRVDTFGHGLALRGWTQPSHTVTGARSPQNGGGAVADPRVMLESYPHTYGVLHWHAPSHAITGSMDSPGTGPCSVGDVRVDTNRPYRSGTYGVVAWGRPAGTITGNAAASTGAFSVGDVRLAPERVARNGTYGVLDPREPAGTVTGEAHVSTGAFALADARLAPERSYHDGAYGVLAWDAPSGTVTGGAGPSSGVFSVADTRLPPLAEGRYAMNWHIGPWTAPVPCITGATDVQTGALCVADPRVRLEANNPRAYNNTWVVVPWLSPSPAVTGGTGPSSGAASLADPRLTCTPRTNGGAYGVLRWSAPAMTVTGALCIDNGWGAIADERLSAVLHPGALALDAPQATQGRHARAPHPRRPRKVRRTKAPAPVRAPLCGFWAVPDRRVPGSPALALRWHAATLKSTPPFAPVFTTQDGSWHRPLTTLELAVLQGLPARHQGAPLWLVGKNASAWRERIGNMVPVGAARSIARQMLFTLVNAAAGVFVLSGPNDGDVWVDAPCGELGTSAYYQ